MFVVIKMLSGDIFKIKVISEYNSFAMAYDVQDAIGSFLKMTSNRIIMFRNEDKISLFDEVDCGTTLNIFVDL